MMRLFFATAINVLGIWLASHLITGFDFTGSFLELAGAAVIFAFLNWTVRPVLKLITGPLIVLTLGLFLVVVNAAILWLLDLLVPTLTIAGLIPLLFGTVLIGALNLITAPVRPHKHT